MEPIEFDVLDREAGKTIDVGAFHQVQRATGADFYEDYGRLWTRSFGDPDVEYRAVREDVGIWDIYALIKWHFTGPDALRALERMTTRRMLDADPGTIRYALVFDDNGMMLDEGTNFVVARDDVFFMGNDDMEGFTAHVARLTEGLDVEVENATDRMPNVAVQGPRSFELLSGLTQSDLGSLGYFRLIPEPVEIAGIRCLITRTGFTGELGYELYLLDGPGRAEDLWNALVSAGARPFGLDAIQKLRMEMGLVIQEEDYFPGETDPLDMSLEGFIDLDGHDFIGREAFASRAVGQAPQRRFKTLEVSGTDIPKHGTRVMNTQGGDAGQVTSAADSPRFGVLALAVLDSGSAADGTKVRVGEAAATVRPLPLDTEGRPRMNPNAAARG